MLFGVAFQNLAELVVMCCAFVLRHYVRCLMSTFLWCREQCNITVVMNQYAAYCWGRQLNADDLFVLVILVMIFVLMGTSSKSMSC